MRKLLKWIVIGFVGLMIVGALLDDSGEPPATETETPPPTAAVAEAQAEATPTDAPTETTAVAALPGVGERVEAAGVALTVADVARTERLDEFTAAGAEKVFVVLNVIIENTWTDKEPYNPMYFQLADSEGYQYGSYLLVGDRGLLAGEVFPGEKVRGLVAFEVPSGATGLVVTYEPMVIAGGYEPIRIRVSE